MTKLLYLTDSYQKTHIAKIISITKKGTHYEIILNETIFYPQGGGQPSDQGQIYNNHGSFQVTHVRMQDMQVIHEGKLTGKLTKGDTVNCAVNWNLRWQHMQYHSAGHVIHEVIMQIVPGVTPIKANHGKNAFILYQGIINPKLQDTLEKQSNMLVAQEKEIITEMTSYDDMINRGINIFGNLPKNKPLRLITIEGYNPTPDGGTQVANTKELGFIKITAIENIGSTTQVYYQVQYEDVETPKATPVTEISMINSINLNNFKSLIIQMEEEINKEIAATSVDDLERLKVKYFGANGHATQLLKKIQELPVKDRKSAGMLINQFKKTVMENFSKKQDKDLKTTAWFDTSVPGELPPEGHLHIVTQAIEEITQIFTRIGFNRVRYPEVEWDWYAFTALNMPESHPARDEWETFHIEFPESRIPASPAGRKNQESRFSKIVLTPHTSNGQVREMEKRQLPIKMINISKCYRRQIDISHTPMFHQFEGMYIDKNVSIGHLKGFIDYFIKQFFGINRKFRLRPFHFQFTEPSFEVDISCDICNGQGCRLCKEGWLELAGSGMIHPNVLRSGNIDPNQYSGFAIGWGVERTYMMKSGTQLDDIRLIYGNDLRFLEQF